MKKWLVIFALIAVLCALPPSWSAIIGAALGALIALGLGLLVFAGFMCEIWDPPRYRDCP